MPDVIVNADAETDATLRVEAVVVTAPVGTGAVTTTPDAASVALADPVPEPDGTGPDTETLATARILLTDPL